MVPPTISPPVETDKPSLPIRIVRPVLSTRVVTVAAERSVPASATPATAADRSRREKSRAPGMALPRSWRRRWRFVPQQSRERLGPWIRCDDARYFGGSHQATCLREGTEARSTANVDGFIWAE